jgi:hypothetical protein
MHLDEKLDAAASVHTNWLFHLKRAIDDGHSEFDPTTVRRDDACDFGKLLYGDFAQRFGRTKEYEELRGMHAEFHRAASGILSMAIAGRRAEAAQAIAPGSEYLRLSGALLMKLRGLKSR